ncbi:MAG TPA: hypothetical protein VII73_00600 [Caulobacteraceae bacterium]
MAKFVVLCRVDAYFDYTAEVEADSAEDAAWLAREDSVQYKWKELGPVEFDARGYVALDSEGDEIDSSRCGYFG